MSEKEPNTYRSPRVGRGRVEPKDSSVFYNGSDLDEQGIRQSGVGRGPRENKHEDPVVTAPVSFQWQAYCTPKRLLLSGEKATTVYGTPSTVVRQERRKLAYLCC